MSLQRKVYETRSQKVADFLIGVGLMIGVNAVFYIIAMILASGMTFWGGSSSGSAFGNVGSIVLSALYCLPFVVNIGLMIYFGLTRYWIALGMLALIAFGLLMAFLLSAACFVLTGAGSAGWFNK